MLLCAQGSRVGYTLKIWQARKLGGNFKLAVFIIHPPIISLNTVMILPVLAIGICSF